MVRTLANGLEQSLSRIENGENDLKRRGRRKAKWSERDYKAALEVALEVALKESNLVVLPSHMSRHISHGRSQEKKQCIQMALLSL